MWFNLDSTLRASSPGLNITSHASHSISSTFLPTSSPSICRYFVHRLMVNFSRHLSRHLAVNILDITSCCFTVHYLRYFVERQEVNYLDILSSVIRWIYSVFYHMSETEFSRFFFCAETSHAALNNSKFPCWRILSPVRPRVAAGCRLLSQTYTYLM